MSDAGFEIAKLVIAVFGGIVIAWYWNYRRHTLEQYRYLDQLYQDLLRMYRDDPQFGNPLFTDHYASRWPGEEGLRYHYFAMTVHTVMESLYDLYGEEIPDQWAHIFAHHTRLHSAWLRDNLNANRPGYVKRALRDGASN